MNAGLEADFESAVALFHDGALAEAERACQAILAAAPELPDAHHLHAAVLFQDRRPGEAAAAARKLVDLAPDFADGWHLLAVCLVQSGDPAGAADCFEKTLALEPDMPDVQGNYAVVLAQTGRRAEARAAFERAVAAPDADPDCLMSYGMMLEEDREEIAALALYSRALNTDETSAFICETYAKLAIRLGECAAAAAALNAIAERRPDLPFVWFYLGQALLGGGDTAGGAEAMARYMALDPEDRLGAKLALAAHGAADAPEGPSEAYLTMFYRSRAHKWDRTVNDAYHGHDLIMAAFAAARTELDAGNARTLAVLDAGCGTGGLGQKLRPFAARLDGIDISPEMVAEAEAKGVYDDLETGDLFAFLTARPESYDIVVAAAVLFHYRDLEAVLRPIAAALRPGGQAVFTLFDSGGADMRVNAHGFFEHSRKAIEAAIGAAGLKIAMLEEAIHEYDSEDRPRPCFCVRCKKA